MRKETILNKSRYMAKKECPWATIVVKVYGGYICFESITDYEIWKNQK